MRVCVCVDVCVCMYLDVLLVTEAEGKPAKNEVEVVKIGGERVF